METDGYTIPNSAAAFDTTILRWRIDSRARGPISVSARQSARCSSASIKAISGEAMSVKASAAPVDWDRETQEWATVWDMAISTAPRRFLHVAVRTGWP